MTDSFLLLTPILILPLVALFAFVGCGFTAGTYSDFLITATPGDGEIIIGWPSDINADKFEVRRGEDPAVLAPVHEAFGGAAWKDQTVTNGTEYYYVVVKWTGDSPLQSNQVSATPTGPIPPPPVLTAFVTGKMTGNTVSVSGWFGLAFMVGSRALKVRSLGRAYAPGNNGTHRLRLIDASANVLVGAVDVQITPGTAGEFQYAPLANAVTLAANREYYLVSEETAGADQFYNHTTTLQTTNVAVVTGSLIGDGTTHSKDLAGNAAYGPLDFQYEGP